MVRGRDQGLLEEPMACAKCSEATLIAVLENVGSDMEGFGTRLTETVKTNVGPRREYATIDVDDR